MCVCSAHEERSHASERSRSVFEEVPSSHRVREGYRTHVACEDSLNRMVFGILCVYNRVRNVIKRSFVGYEKDVL